MYVTLLHTIHGRRCRVMTFLFFRYHKYVKLMLVGRESVIFMFFKNILTCSISYDFEKTASYYSNIISAYKFGSTIKIYCRLARNSFCEQFRTTRGGASRKIRPGQINTIVAHTKRWYKSA